MFTSKGLFPGNEQGKRIGELVIDNIYSYGSLIGYPNKGNGMLFSSKQTVVNEPWSKTLYLMLKSNFEIVIVMVEGKYVGCCITVQNFRLLESKPFKTSRKAKLALCMISLCI